MALFTLSAVIFTVYGSIACCVSCRSCDGDDQGHHGGHSYQASPSRSIYGSVTIQPTYQPRPSPTYTRDSYSHTKTPTVSRLNRVSPPYGGQCPRVTSYFEPLTVRALTFSESPAGLFLHLVLFLWRSAAWRAYHIL